MLEKSFTLLFRAEAIVGLYLYKAGHHGVLPLEFLSAIARQILNKNEITPHLCLSKFPPLEEKVKFSTFQFFLLHISGSVYLMHL